MSVDFREDASRIGAALCRDAVWSGERCCWMSRSIDEMAPGTPPTLKAIGGDLYGGTAGVALFLAELVNATGEAAEFRRTAEGALTHAWSCLDRIAPTQRLGLYGGWMGIAWATARAGEGLKGAWTERALALATRAFEQRTGNEPLDVIAGHAGAIAALLAFDRLAPASSWIEAATSLARELAAAAITEGDTWSWPTVRATGAQMGTRPLTGFAHGAAGMGLALLETGVRANRDDLVNGAEAAFRYEDQLFSVAEGNWPDFRTWNPKTSEDVQQPSYALGWCHGAPGIGLARIRALALRPDHAAWRGDAIAAAETTARAAARLGERRVDASPCHGVAGLSELLIVASTALHQPRFADAAVSLWSRLCAREGASCSWPTSLPSGAQMPGLMLGLAGVGHGLLRLTAPETTPSVLLLGG